MRELVLIPILSILPLNAGGIPKDKQLHFFAGAALPFRFTLQPRRKAGNTLNFGPLEPPCWLDW